MLPEIKKGQTLDIAHFPTKFQALVFRLWESVPAKRLAKGYGPWRTEMA